MRSCKNTIAKKQHGFTIVELLVVMVVIGVLAAISVVSYSGVTKKAIESSLASNLSNFKKQLEMQFIENNFFPSKIKCPATNPDEICLEANDDTEISLVEVGDGTSEFTISAKKAGTVLVATRNSQPKKYIPTVVTAESSGNYIEKEVGDHNVLIFRGDGTFKVTTDDDINLIDVLVVAGGGGGGSSRPGGGGGGGGGAGEYREKSSYIVAKNQVIDISVGAGGAGGAVNQQFRGDYGKSSSFGPYEAKGGGGGGGCRSTESTGGEGASGGGAGFYTWVPDAGFSLGGKSILVPGSNGYPGGDYKALDPRNRFGTGGGGAKSVGKSNTNTPSPKGGQGGVGIVSSISGDNSTYAAGGKGGDDLGPILSGADNSGNGGDGAFGNNSTPGNGGSGVVIIKYKSR